MGSPATIDLASALSPISDTKPAGDDVRFAGPHDEIQEARREDVGSMGEWQREAKTAQWDRVIKIASQVLTERSKDLQVAAWLTEGLVNQHGFAGLRDGLTVVLGLQETFWDGLYPTITDDGDLELRASPISWMNEKLAPSIRSVPITGRVDGVAYSSFDHEEGRTVDNLQRQSTERYERALAEGKVTGAQFETAFLGTPRAVYERLFDDLSAALTEAKKLVAFVLERYGKSAPALTGLLGAVEECHDLVERLVKRKRELEPDLVEENHAGGAAASGGGSAPAGALPLEPRDRADALRRLTAVAAFFRRTEPHSPISYLIERSVKWAGMPLEVWLQDVIGTETALQTIRSTLGLKDGE